MVKVLHPNVKSKEQAKKVVKPALFEGGQVGLSYSAQSHRFFIHAKLLRNGESSICIKSTNSWNTKSKPPKRALGSEVIQDGLTSKAKSMIKKAARILHDTTSGDLASFVTLSYGKNVPSDKEAKKHLDMFFKRVRRKHGNFLYLWVAEQQKRGAIHFHIACNVYIPKKWLNKAWNQIVNKWQSKNGFDIQTVLPNVRGVNKIGSYMAKYISKNGSKIRGNMYNISSELRKQMQPVKDLLIEVIAPITYYNDLCNDVFIHANNVLDKADKTAISFTYGKYSNGGIWLSNCNEYMFNEFTNYKLLEIKNEIELLHLSSPKDI